MAIVSKSKDSKRRSKIMKKQKSDKSKATKKDSRDTCPHCVGGPETYGYLKRSFVFDVDLARKIVSDGREPVEMDDSDVAYCVDNCRIHDEHLDHVNPEYPGLLAHLWGPGADGTIEQGHLLIDGNHRAARCLRDGLTFRAYLLTEDESEQILVRGTDRHGVVRGE